MKNAKADAALYLLTGLLQRIGAERPGMIPEMIKGIEGDRASLNENIEDKEHVEKIFEEAIELLTRANNA